MAKFFVPGNAPQSSESVYDWIVRYVKAVTDCEIEPVRIFSLDYTHEGRQFKVTVGERDPRTGQLVIAILRSDAYLICTPYYGVRMGEPMRVSVSEVREVQYFEGLDHARQYLSAAVQVLDAGDGSLQSRVHAAAAALSPVLLDDFPAGMAGDYLSLMHKLGWRGSQDDTIRQMTDAEAEDAAAAIRVLYVDVLRPAPGTDTHR